MLQTLRETLMLSSKDSLARAFQRLGWAGLLIQIVIGLIPVLLAVYALIFDRTTSAGARGGSLLIEYLTIAGLIVLVFTTIVLVFSIWLLFRNLMASVEFPYAANEE
jgi:Protein of unknown function (DUF3611)